VCRIELRGGGVRCVDAIAFTLQGGDLAIVRGALAGVIRFLIGAGHLGTFERGFCRGVSLYVVCHELAHLLKPNAVGGFFVGQLPPGVHEAVEK
jgi:hypothetical protein